MAQGAETSEDLLASRLEGAAESASDSDHAEHMAKLHTLINSVAKPESTAPTDKEADTLDILVEKHEELEAAKALLARKQLAVGRAGEGEALLSKGAGSECDIQASARFGAVPGARGTAGVGSSAG